MSQHATAVRSTISPILLAIAGLLALAVAMGIGRFAFTPVLPMMLADGGLSLADGGLLASANYLGYFGGALAATAIRVRPQTAIRAGMAAIAVTTLAMGLHLPLALWLLLRLLAGIASAWVLISISSWSLAQLAQYRRPMLSSVIFSGVGIGIAAAGLLCMALIHAHAASAHAWFTLGAVSLVITGAIWRVFRDSPRAAEAPAAAAPRLSWNAEAVRLVVCYGVFGFGYIIPATFLPVMARDALQDATLFAWSWPLFGAAAALSTLAAAQVIRRVGNRVSWIACHLIMAIGVILPVVWPHIAAIFLAALLVGGTFMVITLNAMQEARRVAGPAATVLIAAMTSSFAAGQIAGPLLITYGFGGSDGFARALLAASVLLVLSALALAQGMRAATASPR